MRCIRSMKITIKTLKFKFFPMNFPYFIRNMLYKIFSFNKKVSNSFFNNVIIEFVCLSLYLRFSKKIFLSIIQCNQFYHTYVIWKYSVLSEKVSSSFFNCILIVFVCLSFYLSFLFKKILFYKLSYVILNFIMHVR